MKMTELLPKVRELLQGNVRILGRTLFSPSEKRARQELAQKVRARLITYDSIGNILEAISGEEASYGQAIIPRYRIAEAELIFALENDFLGTWLAPELFTKEFSQKRNPDGKMNRLIVAESHLTLTGSNADTRLALNAGSHLTLGLALANLLLPSSPLARNTQLKNFLAPYTVDLAAQVTGVNAEKIQKLAEELGQYKGRSLVLCGGGSVKGKEAGASQIVANLLNTLLNNEGKTILAKNPYKEENDLSPEKELLALRDELMAGKVDVLLIDRANPAYELSALGMAEAIAKAKTVIYMGYHHNDTAVLSHYIIPVSHYLESWSDGLCLGYYSVAQPAIRPLFDTLGAGDIILKLAGIERSFADYVKDTARKYIKGDFATGFVRLLSEGYTLAESGSERPRTFRVESLRLVDAPKTPQEGFRLMLYPTVALGDGQGANNAFRQELPDPISKMTWDNYVAVSVKDARRNRWRMGDVLRLDNGRTSIEAPVFVQPGLREGTMAIALGYGQKHIGAIGSGVGKNGYALALPTEKGLQFYAIPITVEKTGKKHKLATTQKHYELATERGLVRIARLQEYRQNPRVGHEHEEVPHPGPDGKSKAKGLYKEHSYGPYRWSLNIDLTKCTGCSACVVSCYSENNIPVVGKDDVLVGREMSWLRIDRYYSYLSEQAEKEDPDMVNPEVFFQPVMCQHCENAPCENVCPVGATGHSEDGLNYMSYNRCIGTRYCQNNCPYKVRRFNFFEYWEGKIRDPQQLALNPDVTVRSRGVIEKCSFCQQRISEKRQQAKLEGRMLKDGELKTACQEACPADAITFGNINDEGSQIAAKWRETRTYTILSQLKTEPAVSYQVKIKNEEV